MLYSPADAVTLFALQTYWLYWIYWGAFPLNSLFYFVVLSLLNVVLYFKSSSLQKCQFDNEVRVFNVLTSVHCMFSLLNWLSSLSTTWLNVQSFDKIIINPYTFCNISRSAVFSWFCLLAGWKTESHQENNFSSELTFFLNSYNYFWFKLFQIKLHQFSFCQL